MAFRPTVLPPQVSPRLATPSPQPPVNEYGLRMIDVSDPARPRPLGFYPTQAEITDVAIVGNDAYFITAGQVHILDVSNPTAPTEVGVYQTLSVAYDLNLAGETLYVAENNTLSNLQEINISNPASPLWCIELLTGWAGNGGR